MIKYGFILYFPDGDRIDSADEGELFDTEQEAEEAASEWISNYKVGGEILNLSNPGDYPYEPDVWSQIESSVYEVEVDKNGNIIG